MRSIIRKDEQAVSPVIATILMVAITVVLAAVLYVMVSGLISGPGGTPTAWGVNIGKSQSQTNWTLTRSEERRVGKECRSRRTMTHSKKKQVTGTTKVALSTIEGRGTAG